MIYQIVQVRSASKLAPPDAAKQRRLTKPLCVSSPIQKWLNNMSKKLIEGKCHCGVVRFSISENPKWLIDCNCSICRRIGALWGHVETGSATISCDKNSTIIYCQGEKTLAIHTCKTCGCTTHWENLKPGKSSRMAVNFRMCSESDIAKFKIRPFDGANTWQFLDWIN